MILLGRPALFFVGLALAGCGEDGEDDPARTVNVHVSTNLRVWPDSARAVQLAVEDANGRAGQFRVRVIVHDESSPENDATDPTRVRRNAEAAARDPNAIAYVGDVNSSSTAISAPILNRAGVLQVTPASTYVGLTRPEGGGPKEPEKYRPSGRRTLARVIPADHVQARAGVIYARALGVKRLGVVSDDTLYGRGLSKLVLAAARDISLDVTDAGAGGDLAGRARSALAGGADAVYFAACGPPGQMLDVAEGLRGTRVLTGDCYHALDADVRQSIQQLDGRFFVTAPGGGLERTDAGSRWFERWRERVGSAPDDKLAFCYETMAAVLDAVDRAGARGDDRAAVVRAFFATRNRESIVGRYGIDRHGDTTLRVYGGFAVRSGRMRFDRIIDTRG